jgi:hypothetical protein
MVLAPLVAHSRGVGRSRKIGQFETLATANGDRRISFIFRLTLY